MPRKPAREFQRRALRIGGRRVAARCGSRTSEELHTQAAERQSSVRHAHFAGDAADGHLLEQHLLQLGIERKVEVARDFERLRGSRRLGGRLGSSFPAGGFFVGRHGVHDLVQVEQLGFHVEAPRKHVAPQQVADVTRSAGRWPQGRSYPRSRRTRPASSTPG